MDRWKEFCKLNRIAPQYEAATLSVNPRLCKEKHLFGIEWGKKPTSLLITGETGRGKTYFMHALMRELVVRTYLADIRFFKSKKLDDSLCDSLQKFGSTNYLIESINDVPFLFIDDFGVDRYTERLERDYYEIIDERVAWQRVTVISTNLNEEGIAEKYGARISSRLSELRGIIFDGKDLRTFNRGF